MLHNRAQALADHFVGFALTKVGKRISPLSLRCLVKNLEYRPYMVEIVDHPFLTSLPQNYDYLNQELRLLCEQYSSFGKRVKDSELIINSNWLKTKENGSLKEMHLEDLGGLDEINEENVLAELKSRLKLGQFCTFIGDILLVLNSNEQQDVNGEEQHAAYVFKSRSDNAPHIYSVADSAYQAALHHQSTQHILLSGESASGKTSNYLHLVDHLLYLGKNTNISQDRIKNAIKLLHAFTHASTPTNDYSTRCLLQTDIIYGGSGINTGARFEVHQIEKWRVSSTDMLQANYHILYYFYDGVKETNQLEKYQLTNDKTYRYLRISGRRNTNRPRDNPKQNIKKYHKILDIFKEFEFKEQQLELIFKTLAAIINLGEVRLRDKQEAEIENEEAAIKVARLLNIDEKKFSWALTNYCVILDKETATRRKRTCEEARDVRDVLANLLYCRIVQYVVMIINKRLLYGSKIFGNKYSIRILDYYGFECFRHNQFSQLLINSTNELLQYHYVQRVFAWEALETHEENIPYKPICYYNNKNALDEMLGKLGLLNLIDEISKQGKRSKQVIERLQSNPKVYINKIKGSDFCVNHYTGKVVYDSQDMPDKNKDFLPPEIIDTLRRSNDPAIKMFFASKLTNNGNLCDLFDDNDTRKIGEHSQTRKIRTVASTFKAFVIQLLKELSIGGSAGGTHFVRCVRSDLQGNPRGFHTEIVRQQLRAMSVVETAQARQKGFSHRISFPEFIKRYKFLAFDFDENVEVTKENCRLLLVRLKMEGWAIGKTKVFLKYYNEEYLSRLYETQVKKVIKIQSMIRAYLARRKMENKIKSKLRVVDKGESDEGLTQDEAATVVQKAYRKYLTAKSSKGMFDKELADFIRHFFNKWKSKSIFQVLLQYRAAKFQDMYNLSQQVHLYNQNVMNTLLQMPNVNLESIDSKAKVEGWLGERKMPVMKLPFRLNDIPYFDTSYMCEPSTTDSLRNDLTEESWDSALKWRESVSSQITSSVLEINEKLDPSEDGNKLIKIPYTRNPLEVTECLASPTADSEDEKSDHMNKKITEKVSNDNSSKTTTSANKDFEYIRAPPLPKVQKTKLDYVNPINELEQKGKLNSHLSDDDPPFNFQGMLRKTNFHRNSIKREENNRGGAEVDKKANRTELEIILTKNFKNVDKENNDIGYNYSKQEKEDLMIHKNNNNMKEESVLDKKDDNTEKKERENDGDSKVFGSTEIAPGIYLEGTAFDL